MMKKNIFLSSLLLGFLFLLNSCEEDYQLDTLVAPTNLELSYEISGVDDDNLYGDGSGTVTFTTTADDAITYTYNFNDGTDEEVAADGIVSHNFTSNGIVTYDVTVTAVGTGGISSTASATLDVYCSFSDEEAVEYLTGGSSRTWYWAADESGHLGLGYNNTAYGDDYTWASWYQASAWEKSASNLYDCEFTFTYADGELTFEQVNESGTAYIQGDYVSDYGYDEEGSYEFDIDGVKSVTLSSASSVATEVGDYWGTTMNFSDDGFFGFYMGTSEYEIVSISDTELQVRAVQGNNSDYAWYHTFTTTKPSEDDEDEVDVEYTDLLWSDEFDTDGTPDTTIWTYDLGDDGWGNSEEQNYTSDADNVYVSDGTLKIVAKAEDDGSYTSARLKTEDLKEFTYGRVDVRAKLPEGVGTWPAIWMLGANYSTNTWPACGEIDIMEAVGSDVGSISSSIHTTSSSGDTSNTGDASVEDPTSEWHVYSMNWSEDEISFLVDDVIHYTYDPSTQDDDTWPFDTDQFIILNVAMGGTLGGTIADDFVSGTMEIDYVRVYQ
ncbi:family 16 glycosylhydrolase [Labilibaculum sp.]|uniref:family 16 glycosylhydrolase n=1 Tax=Labilibaculum sp. TaxID=2060723 RepID=UPI00356571B6